MRVTYCLYLSLILASAAQAERTPVITLKPLLIEAIHSGHAEGVLVGHSAYRMSQDFGSKAPITVDVDVVGEGGSPQCRQLRVTTRQAAVVENGAPAEDKSMAYQIRYCDTEN